MGSLCRSASPEAPITSLAFKSIRDNQAEPLRAHRIGVCREIAVTTSAQAQPAVQEAVASFQGRIADLRAQIGAAKAALTAVTATVQSADATVQVTVDSSGALTGIEFGGLDGVTAQRLATQVLGAYRDARVAVLDKARESVIERVGPDNPAVAVLAARAEAMKQAVGEASEEPDAVPAEPVLATAGAPSIRVDAEEIGYVGRGR